jgi:protein-tyrosine-phosphatase
MTHSPSDDGARHHHLELGVAADRLTEEFAGVIEEDTVRVIVESSYHHVAGQARIPTFVPLIVERFARVRLRALARIEGQGDPTVPRVLFLCVRNSGRSQMAMGFFREYARDRALSWSGGSDPATEMNPNAIEAMAERGIDISDEFPKPWTEEIVRAADVVVTMGCGDSCPVFPGKRYEEWELEDPADLDLDSVRRIRDDIDARVRHLAASLGLPAS